MEAASTAANILAALVPAVLLTRVSGGPFIAELAIVTGAKVVSHMATGGWLG